MKSCTTHHYACDCREQLFNKGERSNAQAAKLLLEVWRMGVLSGELKQRVHDWLWEPEIISTETEEPGK